MWDGLWISFGNWAMQVEYSSVVNELIDSNDYNLDSLEDENELVVNDAKDEDKDEEEMGDLVAMPKDTLDSGEGIGLVASISLLFLKTLLHSWNPLKIARTSLESIRFSLALEISFWTVDLDFSSEEDALRLLIRLGDRWLISFS